MKYYWHYCCIYLAFLASFACVSFLAEAAVYFKATYFLGAAPLLQKAAGARMLHNIFISIKQAVLHLILW